MEPPEASRPVFRLYLRWFLLISAIGIAAGLSSALFLWLLEISTATFTRHPQLIYGLPAAGGLLAYISHWVGSAAASQGNNAIIRGIKGDLNRVPFIMAPFILVTTLLTHLFGASAGREGTAVQMSGSLADTLLERFEIPQNERAHYLRAAVAAGFGAVFGTPIAGALFGIEVSNERKSVTFPNLIPCLVASLIGDFTCRLTGIGHAEYSHIDVPSVTPTLLFWMLVCGVAIGLLAVVFIEAQHFLSRLGTGKPTGWRLRPLLGGIAILMMTLMIGSNDFNGLGLPLIVKSLNGSQLPVWTFAIKLAFTMVTLGSGFKGGEVTPLFCIGSLFGNGLAGVGHQDPKFFAGLGFVSLFAAAANVPLTGWVLAMELFGPRLSLLSILVIGIAYLVSGRCSIYAAQWETASE
jgi:H+/Cl- antiporter ClcA